jgi:hypothetical protein
MTFPELVRCLFVLYDVVNLGDAVGAVHLTPKNHDRGWVGDKECGEIVRAKETDPHPT